MKRLVKVMPLQYIKHYRIGIYKIFGWFSVCIIPLRGIII